MVGPAEDGQVSLPATMLDTFRRWCYYPARYFGVCERDIRQLINTFVAPVSREVPIAPNGGSRVGGTSAPVSGGPTWFRPTAASLRSHPPRSGPGGFFCRQKPRRKTDVAPEKEEDQNAKTELQRSGRRPTGDPTAVVAYKSVENTDGEPSRASRRTPTGPEFVSMTRGDNLGAGRLARGPKGSTTGELSEPSSGAAGRGSGGVSQFP